MVPKPVYVRLTFYRLDWDIPLLPSKPSSLRDDISTPHIAKVVVCHLCDYGFSCHKFAKPKLEQLLGIFDFNNLSLQHHFPDLSNMPSMRSRI